MCGASGRLTTQPPTHSRFGYPWYETDLGPINALLIRPNVEITWAATIDESTHPVIRDRVRHAVQAPGHPTPRLYCTRLRHHRVPREPRIPRCWSTVRH